MKLICGEQGLKNEIKGVTIIEAPDIVKFINGGELLLTGLYAFKSCSIEEFQNYLQELRKKEISCLVIKKGRCDGFIIRVWRETGNPDIAYLQHTEKQTDTDRKSVV